MFLMNLRTIELVKAFVCSMRRCISGSAPTVLLSPSSSGQSNGQLCHLPHLLYSDTACSGTGSAACIIHLQNWIDFPSASKET